MLVHSQDGAPARGYADVLETLVITTDGDGIILDTQLQQQ